MIKKGIVLGDQHCPYQDKKIIKLQRRFIEAFKPDEIVLIGDFLNYATYSKHGKRKNENVIECINDEHTEGVITLDILFTDIKANLIWLDGNHEVWQDEYYREYPDFFDRQIHRYERMQLKKRGFKTILAYGKSYKSGKLYFTHGWRCGVNAVRDHLIRDYKANFVMGHIHRSDIATSSNIDSHTIQGYSIGCSSKLDFNYTRLRTSNHGFGVYYVLPGGNFTFYNIVIINYQFVFDNQLWKI